MSFIKYIIEGITSRHHHRFLKPLLLSQPNIIISKTKQIRTFSYANKNIRRKSYAPYIFYYRPHQYYDLLFTRRYVHNRSILVDRSNDELLLYGNDILKELLTRKDLHEKDKDRLRNELSGILYQYFMRDNENYLMKLFEIISNRKQCNEASYTIMMRYFADQNNLEKVKYFFNQIEQDQNILAHARSYVPLVTVCLRLKEYELGKAYFDQLLEHSRKKYKDNAFQDILLLCSQLVTIENETCIKPFVYSIFDTLKEFGSGNLQPRTIDAIMKCFQSDPSENWNIEDADVIEGVCQSCNTKLETATIPEKRALRLKRNLMMLIEASIARKTNSRLTDVKPLKTNVNIRNKIENQSKYFEVYDILTMEPGNKNKDNNTKHDIKSESKPLSQTNIISPEVFSKLKSLEEYIDANGPFDVVIDVLNVGYFSKGFNPLQVRDVVNMFTKKRCLILCAGILKEEILSQETVAPANTRLKQLLLYLQKHCNLFFVGSSVLDDYYILYTILHHDFNIELVSRDLFRDHLFHLDSENTADFQRWQQANQYVLKSFTSDNKPMFMDRMSYKVSMQKSVDGVWHLPVSENNWLCIRKYDGFSKP